MECTEPIARGADKELSSHHPIVEISLKGIGVGEEGRGETGRGEEGEGERRE